MVEPDEVRNPRGVAVTGDDDVVANVVLGQVVEGTVTVGLVSIPCVVIERVSVAVANGFVDFGENSLRADDPPASTAGGGLAEGIVEPVLLTAAHEGTSSIVGDLVDVIGVPVKIGDGTVVLAGVEHDQVEQRADLEVTPDA